MGRTDEEIRAKFASQRAADEAHRKLISSLGGHLATDREMELTFIAPNAEKANELAQALTQNELRPQPVKKSATDQRFFVVCTLAASVDVVTKEENVANFVLFADKYDCEYDGWGTRVTEAAAKIVIGRWPTLLDQ
jgi:hypothetical protein